MNGKSREIKTCQDDHVYFNVVVANTSPLIPVPAEYNQPLQQVLIDSPGDYHLCIQRFTIPLQGVPIFVFQDNAYSVTLSYNNTDYQTYLQYVSTYTPSVAVSSPENRYIYSYEQFIQSINDAFATSMDNLTNALPEWDSKITYTAGQAVYVSSPVHAGVRLPYVSANGSNLNHDPLTSPDYWFPLTTPYLVFTPTTQLVSLYASRGWHNVNFTDANQTLKIWFNTLLYGYFISFDKLFNGFIPDAFNANGKNANIIVKPLGNNEVTIPAEYEFFGLDIEGYGMSQEFSTLYDWNALRNVVLFTSTIPIKNEAIPSTIINPWFAGATYTLGSSVVYNFVNYVSIAVLNVGHRPDISPAFWRQEITSSVASSYLPILTDFQIQSESGTESRSYAQYVPSGEYRLIDLTGTIPIKNIDIKVFWQDKYLNLYPLYIPPLNSMDIKLLFRKKTSKGGLTY